jgi:O-methyltransferase
VTIKRRVETAVRVGLERAGLEQRSHRLVDLEPDFWALHERCAAYTMTSVERMHALHEAVAFVVRGDVPGDYVECGVWRGGSSMLAALQLQRLGDAERRLWLYDTFAGMPEPTARDTVERYSGQDARAEWARQQAGEVNLWCYGSLDEVRANMLSTGLAERRLELVPGKVEDTLPALAPPRISVLRLDTDWYESTRHELVHLFPRLSPGGVLIVDDYGAWPGARQAVDEYFAEHGVRMLLNRIDYSGRIGVKLA